MDKTCLNPIKLIIGAEKNRQRSTIMNEESGSKIKAFIINHWVSWVIEIAILGVVAYFTIAETRKTAEKTSLKNNAE